MKHNFQRLPRQIDLYRIHAIKWYSRDVFLTQDEEKFSYNERI